MGRVRRAARWLYTKVGADFEVPSPLPADGRFPSITQSLLWDLLPDHYAPDADGLLAPAELDTRWIQKLPEADLDFRYEVAKAAREYRQNAVAEAEEKASRLLTPTVTLLAACAALSAYQLAKAHTAAHPLLDSLAAVPAALALLFFTISALRSLDTDVRVGYYRFAELTHASAEGREAFLRESIRLEVLGAYWAKWSGAQKKGSLMQARAWFSRGVVFLVTALGIAAITRIWIK